MGRDIWRPKPISREAILDTLGDQGDTRWRNPFRIPEVVGSFPKPQDGRAREYEKIMGTSTTWAEKGRP